MGSPRVLVVDSDRSSLGLLTHGMNRFGLTSSGVSDLDQARALLASERPDVVVSEVGSGTGLKVLEEIRRNPMTREVPVVLLAKGPWARRRAHARELGAQELIAKPAYVQDIAVLTWLHAGRGASDDTFEGTFGEPSCAALLRGLLAGGRTGTLKLEPFGATVRFRDGAVVDASLPPLSGERALMRILTLGTGSYELSFGTLDLQATMKFELGDLAGRGLRHLQQWQEIQSQLEPMDQVLTVDYGALSSQISGLPAGLWSLLRLFDGQRSILEVIADSTLDDITTAQAIAKLKNLQIFEQQRRLANAEPIRAYEVPGPAIPEARVARIERMESLGRAEQVEDLPPLAADAEIPYRPAVPELTSGLERSFFDSPVEELYEARRERKRRDRSIVRMGGWGVVALVLFGAMILFWKSTETATPPTASPVAQAQPAQPVAAPAAPAAVPTPAAPVAAAPAPAAATAEANLAAPAAQAGSEAAPAAEGSAEAAAPAPQNPEVNKLLADGQKLYDRGQFTKALATYDRANALAPEDPAVALARGLTYYELGDLEHSGAALTKVLELDPKNARAELLLGAIAQEKGDPGIAKQHYKKYLELDPHGEHAAETQKLLTRLGG